MSQSNSKSKRTGKFPAIGLFHRHPYASAHCCVGMLKALSESFRVELLDVQECTYQRMRSMQIVAFPGGVGDASVWSQLLREKKEDVQRYIQSGGGYLGICMGAYWAGPEYFDLVPGTLIGQYIKADGAEIRRSYMTTAAVSWKGSLEDMFFWDGPVFSGEVGEVVGRYKNGEAMAIRRGKVGLIGCHPESQEDWYARKYLKPLWHGGRHGTLLVEFARGLCS